ncbi:hypothetical protein JCM19037_1008 [Geomicrobium sp. JCM 19037]|uniref:YusW family protein n=1 Tax=unclassified Geomicrobium TaxID=2628951 RepID=UPI00045F401A|nr:MULTISPECIES: YusW family protein [unclassified Geomicrobium]GAK02752.1 hypothetical protein JCM19037_1008 [Geomicrobium sp. JCM 19037]
MKKIILCTTMMVMLTACGTGMDETDTNGNGNGGTDGAETSEEPTDMSMNLSNPNSRVDNNESGNGENAMNENGSAYDRGVVELEIDIEFQNGEDWEYDYENQNTNVKADVEKGEQDLEGDEAIEEVENLLKNVELHGDQGSEEMVQEVVNALDLEDGDLYKVELYIEFENGNMYQVSQQM